MNGKIINCYELDVVQDIPKELIKLKNTCKTLAHKNSLLKGALIIASIGICAYFIYKNYYDERKKHLVQYPYHGS